MSTANDTTPDAPKSPLQFSLRSLLWLTVVAALALVCVIQSGKLRRAEQALARHAWATSDVAIPPGRFRLLVNTIVDDDDLKVCVLRFEANEEHFVTADGAGSITTASENGSHWAEIKIVASYDETVRRYTLLTRVGSGGGWAGGKSVFTLPSSVDPEEFATITVQPGLYDLQQPVELGQTEGKPIKLSVR